MEEGYNNRLFNPKSIRGKLHFARYYWLKKKIAEYCPEVKTVLELGCFDGKTIDFLPSGIRSFHGYDANWEGGLDAAKETYKGVDKYQFDICNSLEDFMPENEAYDISICMETMEHIPLADLDAYINKLFRATKDLCFITVPNEKGLVLIMKYMVKKYKLKHVPEKYSNRELLNAFLGRMQNVKRNEGGHKGFDYKELIESLSKHFIVEEISGIPLASMPKSLNFSIGIILKK